MSVCNILGRIFLTLGYNLSREVNLPKEISPYNSRKSILFWFIWKLRGADISKDVHLFMDLIAGKRLGVIFGIGALGLAYWLFTHRKGM